MNITSTGKTIFDVGLHKGEDTEFYLKKGFRVIAFEADPELVAFNKRKFEEEINKGNLVIVEGAIVDVEKYNLQSIHFHKNSSHSVWGTVLEDWKQRNVELGSESSVIDVPVVDFKEQLKKFGVPHYIKIDIEGMDHVCLEALKNFDIKPKYISIESEKVSFIKLIEEINLFSTLGYTKFLAVNQSEISKQIEPIDSIEGVYSNHTLVNGSSGLFGSDLRLTWCSKYKLMMTYIPIFLGYFLFGDRGILKKIRGRRHIKAVFEKIYGRKLPGWFDTHASFKQV